MMNKLLMALVVLLFSSAAVFGQSANDRDELSRLLDGFLAGTDDAAVHDRFWADDLIYTRSAGSRINKAELMKSVRSAPKKTADAPTTVYKAEEVQIQLYGTTAVVAFRLVGTNTKTDGTQEVNQFLNTGTFVKRNGQWRAVAWQATAVPKVRT